MSIHQLEQCLARLNARDRENAAGLIASIRLRQARGEEPTYRQTRYVQDLIARAMATPAVMVSIKGLDALPRMLRDARQHLRHPRVLFRVDNKDLVLTIAGERARVPGTINVVERVASLDDDGLWHGRIYDDGRFETSSRTNESQRTAILLALRALAKDPVRAAAEYGHLTGVCCFCGRGLDDERSTRVGYGPVCASHYNLPWG
jgi:hypothetical protein